VEVLMSLALFGHSLFAQFRCAESDKYADNFRLLHFVNDVDTATSPISTTPELTRFDEVKG
jgi:hypothetical protein